jgi:hypothetical protein
MYGLFPALMETQRFRADQDQRAADAEMRRQEMGMRQRQMAMQEEQNRLSQQETGLRLGRMREEDTAVAGLADLQRRDAESQRFDGTGLMRPVDEREMNNAVGSVALARRDTAGLMASRKQNRMLDVAEEAKRLSASPEFQGQAMNYISKEGMFPVKVKPGTRDPKTGRMKTPDELVFDDGFTHTLKDGDRQKIAYGAALMKFGMNDEGLAKFAEVNKDLASLVDKANQRSVAMSQFNSQAEERVARDQDRDEDRAARAAARAAAGGGGAPKVDPKLIAEYNNLVAEYQAAVDSGDTKRELELRKQLPIKQAQMATAMGKTMSLRDPAPGRAERTLTPKDRLDMAQTILASPDGRGMSLQGALQMVDQMTASPGRAPVSEIEQMREALRAQNAAAPKPGLQAPRGPVTFETMPLEVLQGYTGTSPEARAVYMRRLQEKEQLAKQPRFWVNPRQGAQEQEFGLDRGY